MEILQLLWFTRSLEPGTPVICGMISAWPLPLIITAGLPTRSWSIAGSLA